MATFPATPDDKRRTDGINRLISSPAQPGLVDELGRQAGLTARAGIKGVGNLVGLLSDPIGGVINAATGAKLQTAGSLADRVSDAIGLPQPKNGTERVVQDAASAMASGGPLIGAGSKLAQSAAPAARKLGEFFGSAPVAQTVSAAASGGAATAVKENGGGEGAQLAAGVAGAMFPFAAKAAAPVAAKAAKVAYDNAGAVPAVRGPLANQDGIFAGHLSKDAPTWKLEQAKTLQAKGVPDEQIYKETGWFAGMPDKKWRYEIPDNEAHLSGFDPTQVVVKAFQEGGVDAMKAARDEFAGYKQPAYRDGLQRMNDVLEHQKLYDAYPETQYIRYLHQPDNPRIGEGALGEYKGEPIILTSPANDKMMRRTQVHELQHAVQQIEGFAPGGGVNTFDLDRARYAQDMQRLTARDALDEAAKELGGWPTNQQAQAWHKEFWGEEIPEWAFQDARQMERADIQARVNDAYNMFKALPENVDPYKMYKRLAGEAESRLVEKRMNYTPEQRAAIYPPSEFDVPVQDQIVRFGN